jgi:hypothetical protein
MVEQLSESTKQFDTEEYINAGGRWDRRTFDRLMEIVDERETNPIQVRRVCIDQVQSMGIFTGLKFTHEEAYLYGVLCQDPVERTLSQQQLMAEVILLMGNPQKREDFMRIYPNIDFDNSVLQRETSRHPSERVRPMTYNNDTLIFVYGT